MKKIYAKIIVDNRSSQVDRLFTYIVDDKFHDIIQVGMRVIVPFGRGDKLIKGIVIYLEDEFKGEYKLKKIVDIIDDKPMVSEKLIKLGLWMKDEYLSSFKDSLQTVLPPGDYKDINIFVELIDVTYKTESEEEMKIIQYMTSKDRVLLTTMKKDLKINNINKYLNSLESLKIIMTTIDIQTRVKKKKEKWIKLDLEKYSLDEILDIIGERASKQLEIAMFLSKTGDSSLNQIIKDLNTSLSTIQALEDKKVAIIYNKEVKRNPFKREILEYKRHILNPNQARAFLKIITDIEQEKNKNFLLHGVTGSGKTEVYLQLVEYMLDEGKDTIVLVPEISLTPQTIDRFVGRFGKRVAILHSRLSQGERFDQWRSVKEEKVKIVIGARSAVFAPFSNLGLIIIDEEHESTYKSSQNPKYDTIEVAKKRCNLENASLLLGTATPSIETYYKAETGEIELLELENRVEDQTMPQIKVIDMRQELKDGNMGIFSRHLYENIKETLENNKQIILFLNRRGFSTFVSCRNCGYVVKCDDCDVSMTYYKNGNRLRCNYCGITKVPPKICPDCGSKYIKYFGIGTEKVEEITKEIFPQANVVRMDGDTTTKKGSHEEILEAMKNREIDILIGTQMISKGLDFKDVTLVGIIAADTTLNLPDYKSPEKAFQLITQVAGRSGRGDTEGKVVLQTYNPEHYSIQCAKDQDYSSFYKMEKPLRNEFLYPPFINLISILIYGPNKKEVIKTSNSIYNTIGRQIHGVYGDMYKKHIIGPYPAPLEKIKNNFRWQIILKLEDKYLKEIKSLLYEIYTKQGEVDRNNVKLSIDINPNTTL